MNAFKFTGILTLSLAISSIEIVESRRGSALEGRRPSAGRGQYNGARQHASINVPRQPSSVHVPRKSAPINIPRQPSPIHVPRKLAPINVPREPAPIRIHPTPIHALRKSAPIHVPRKLAPIDVPRQPSSVHVPREPAPIHIHLAPIHVPRQPSQTHLSYWLLSMPPRTTTNSSLPRVSAKNQVPRKKNATTTTTTFTPSTTTIKKRRVQPRMQSLLKPDSDLSWYRAVTVSEPSRFAHHGFGTVHFIAAVWAIIIHYYWMV
ncbi:hypothetical protein WR25_23882 [Diploscapter pachys]|uniref:Uncharacterized protein n=1 Tax=Diploscapter pachys TaxID=2018661 RepID=A0A2A2JL12_9BILA|nr:hypothetical protein WR25_23882 [Diploscapter pachys]